MHEMQTDRLYLTKPRQTKLNQTKPRLRSLVPKSKFFKKPEGEQSGSATNLLGLQGEGYNKWLPVL